MKPTECVFHLLWADICSLTLKTWCTDVHVCAEWFVGAYQIITAIWSRWSFLFHMLQKTHCDQHLLPAARSFQVFFVLNMQMRTCEQIKAGGLRRTPSDTIWSTMKTLSITAGLLLLAVCGCDASRESISSDFTLFKNHSTDKHVGELLIPDQLQEPCVSWTWIRSGSSRIKSVRFTV